MSPGRLNSHEASLRAPLRSAVGGCDKSGPYDILALLLPPFMLSSTAENTSYSGPEGDEGRKMIQVVVPCAYSLPSASVKRPSAVAMRPPT